MAAHPLPTYGEATLAMARLFFRTVVRTRKTWVMGLVLLGGLAIAIIGRLFGPSHAASRIYGVLLSQVTLGFVVQLLGLLYGIAAVREDVEARTLTWLLVRPLPRATIVLGRWLGAVALVTGVMVLFALATHLIAATADGPSLFVVLGATALGAIYYTTAFVAIAAVAPRPFLIGLGYVLFWEFALPLVPSNAATLSMKFHLLNLIGAPTAASGPLSFLVPTVEPVSSLLTLVALTAVLGAVAVWVFPRRELLGARES